MWTSVPSFPPPAWSRRDGDGREVAGPVLATHCRKWIFSKAIASSMMSRLVEIHFRNGLVDVRVIVRRSLDGAHGENQECGMENKK
jgi:hypothetical protein